MAKSFRLQVITPNKIFYEGEVVSLIAPGEEGYLGVLADHTPIISNLRPGKITIRPAGDAPILVFNSSGRGFLEVVKNQVTLLLRTLEKSAA